jgi:hypothetical protein
MKNLRLGKIYNGNAHPSTNRSSGEREKDRMKV